MKFYYSVDLPIKSPIQIQYISLDILTNQAGVTCLLYLAPVKSEVFILPEQVAGGHAELPAGQVQGQVHGWGGGQPGHFPHGVHYVLDVYL